MAWYKAGTISVVNGSPNIVGSGTDFLTGKVQIGSALTTVDNAVYEILTVNSSTSITLASNYEGSSVSSAVYDIIPTQSLVAELVSEVTELIADFTAIRQNVGLVTDGTEAAPSIGFINDLDNGLYRVSADSWALVAGASTVASIGTTGLVVPNVFTSTLATGAAPFVVASTTKVSNLNVDLLDASRGFY